MRSSRLAIGVLSCIVAVSCLSGCGNTHARRTIGSIAAEDTTNTSQEGDEVITMVIASNQTSADNPYHYGLQTFKEVVEELSGGTIQVECSDGTLSENETELLEMLDAGETQMVVCSPGNMSSAGVSEINLISLLYLFNGFNHWEAAMDGEFGSTMANIILERTNNRYRIMGYWSAGVRDYYGKIPITTAADVDGLTIRTQVSGVVSQYWTGLGAEPVDIGWGVLYDSLMAGEVDSAENDYTNLMLKEHHKTVNGKYICETHHDYTTRLFIINGNFYDSLTPEQKSWVDTAALAATLDERAVTYDMMEGSKAQCIEEGAIVTNYEDMDIASFQESAIAIQDQYAQENGLTEYLDMIRSAR